MTNCTWSWIFIIVLVLAGVSTVLAGSVAAQSADIVVSTDGSEDYSSIQTAIDNAEQNDRIEVKSGTYSESVDINKNVELVASNGATIAPPSSAVSAVAIENGAEPPARKYHYYGRK